MRVLLSPTGLTNALIFVKINDSVVEFSWGIGISSEHLTLNFPMIFSARAIDKDPKKRFGNLIQSDAMLLMKPITFNIKEIAEQNRHRDFSFYASGYSVETYEPETIDNIFSETSKNKYSIIQLARRYNKVYNSFIITPQKNERSVENCIFGVWAQNEESLITDVFPMVDAKNVDDRCGLPTISKYSKMSKSVDVLVSEPNKRFPDVRSILPELSITGPDSIRAGDIQKYEVLVNGGMFPKDLLENITLQIETNSGYLPKTEVLVKSGAAEFTFRALDLEPGDTTMLKVGVDTFSNIRRIPITIK